MWYWVRTQDFLTAKLQASSSGTSLLPQLSHMWKEAESSTVRTQYDRAGELEVVVQV